MAERKPRQEILKRDQNFTQKIEKRQRLQSAFQLRTEKPEAESEANDTNSATKLNELTDDADVVHRHTVRDSTTHQPTSDTKTPGRKPSANMRNRDTKAMEALRVCFTVPIDLSHRAERAGETARCEAKQIVLHALKELKPSLIAGLSDIKYANIDRSRKENAGIRITTTWHIEHDLMKKISAELDPANMGQTSSLAGYWIRERFLDFFPSYLTRFGV